MTDKQANTKEIIISAALYTSGSILGPLVIFGGGGWVFDVYFQAKPVGIIAGVGAAFVITNILLFKRAVKLTSILQAYGQELQRRKNKEIINDKNSGAEE